MIATSDSGTAEYVYGNNITLFCIVVFGGTPPFTFGDWIPPEGSTSLLRGVVTNDGYTLSLMFTAIESDTESFICTAMDSEGETDSASEELEVGK